MRRKHAFILTILALSVLIVGAAAAHWKLTAAFSDRLIARNAVAASSTQGPDATVVAAESATDPGIADAVLTLPSQHPRRSASTLEGPQIALGDSVADAGSAAIEPPPDGIMAPAGGGAGNGVGSGLLDYPNAPPPTAGGSSAVFGAALASGGLGGEPIGLGMGAGGSAPGGILPGGGGNQSAPALGGSSSNPHAPNPGAGAPANGSGGKEPQVGSGSGSSPAQVADVGGSGSSGAGGSGSTGSTGGGSESSASGSGGNGNGSTGAAGGSSPTQVADVGGGGSSGPDNGQHLTLGAGDTYQGDIIVGPNDTLQTQGGKIDGDLYITGGTVDPTVTITHDFIFDSGVLILHEGDQINADGNIEIGPNALIDLIVADTTSSIFLNDYLHAGSGMVLSIDSSLFDPPYGFKVFTPTGGQLIDLYFKGFDGTTDLPWYHIQLLAADTPVPEPSTLAIFGMGLVGFAWLRRKRRAG